MSKISWSKDELEEQRDGSSGINTGIDSGSSLSQGYQHGSLTKGLVAYYPMENGQGDVLLDGATGNHGQINGVSWNGSGKIGSYALDFNGTDNNVEIERSPAVDLISKNMFTVSFWVKADSSVDGSNSMELASNYSGGDGLIIRFSDRDSDGNSEIKIYGRNDSGPVNHDVWYDEEIIDGTWHHVTWIRDGTDETAYSLYVDGVKSTNENITDTADIGTPKSSSPLRLGSGDGVNYFEGQIEDVRIYNRVLSQPEIQTLTNLTSPSGRKLTESNVPNQANSGTSRYKFNGNVDDYWSDNHGTDKTSTGYTTGIYGQAKKFNSTDKDHVELPNLDLKKSQSFSISCWVKQNTTGTAMEYFGRYDGSDDELQLSSQKEDNVIFDIGHLGGNTIRATTPNNYLEANKWYHIVGIYNSQDTSVKIYGNSRLLDKTTGKVDNFETGEGPWIGARSDGSIYMDGSIDDVRIYKTALTPQQVEQLYQLGAYKINRGDTLQ